MLCFPLKLSQWKAVSKDSSSSTQSCKLQYSTAKLECWYRESKSVHFSNESVDVGRSECDKGNSSDGHFNVFNRSRTQHLM